MAVFAVFLVFIAALPDVAVALSADESGFSGARRLEGSPNVYGAYDGSTELKPVLEHPPAMQMAFMEGVKNKSSNGKIGGADYEESPYEISDPIEPWNRLMFLFNDKLYFWALEPVGSFYAFLVVDSARQGVRDFFYNLTTPVRLVNSLLQLEFKDTGAELARFGINTTLGILGLGDVAKKEFGIERADRDFGQTLGKYGLGSGFYIVWPFIGPSSVRDSVGYAGDYFLDPVNYIQPFEYSLIVESYSYVNNVSLRLGEYEDFKKDSLDTYTALKDAYYQYRRNKVAK